MIRLLKSKYSYVAIRIVGGLLLMSYLATSGDWRLSLPWALAFPAISILVSWLVMFLNLHNRFPRLNRYLLFGCGQSGSAQVAIEKQWALAQATYLESGLRGASVLTAPLEDGFFCVPLLLVGVSPLSAAVSGIVFGAAHLARFTYIECIAKACYYMLVCYFLLPHGLLTVAVGHLLTDIIGLLGLKIAKHFLSRELRSNPSAQRALRDKSAPRP